MKQGPPCACADSINIAGINTGASPISYTKGNCTVRKVRKAGLQDAWVTACRSCSCCEGVWARKASAEGVNCCTCRIRIMGP